MLEGPEGNKLVFWEELAQGPVTIFSGRNAETPQEIGNPVPSALSTAAAPFFFFLISICLRYITNSYIVGTWYVYKSHLDPFYFLFSPLPPVCPFRSPSQLCRLPVPHAASQATLPSYVA